MTSADTDNVEIQAGLVYRDPKTAIAWLERAFGFEPALIVTGSDGKIVHARIELGGASIEIGSETELHRSPASLGGANTQGIHMRFQGPIDELYERAMKAGAKILQAQRQEFYGDLTFVAADLEGHIWRFGQRDARPPGPPPDGWKIDFPQSKK